MKSQKLEKRVTCDLYDALVQPEDCPEFEIQLQEAEKLVWIKTHMKKIHTGVKGAHMAKIWLYLKDHFSNVHKYLDPVTSSAAVGWFVPQDRSCPMATVLLGKGGQICKICHALLHDVLVMPMEMKRV